MLGTLGGASDMVRVGWGVDDKFKVSFKVAVANLEYLARDAEVAAK